MSFELSTLPTIAPQLAQKLAPTASGCEQRAHTSPAAASSVGRPQLAQKRAPKSNGAPQAHWGPGVARLELVRIRMASSSWMRFSIPIA
jgi:hypothetical protein